ncbi:MAG: hypothetical protein KF732_07735 [Flavobacteriales bacterium]|nr:hypothetical protein [Flavobacteriales bacterium]MBX2959835.1 hypothetical protein [Flavobacteriales bacterium]HRN41147.1 hypothetical protein [Vicingus sp.]HRP58712.1 hypothetical protein [Vicingus sp.]
MLKKLTFVCIFAFTVYSCASDTTVEAELTDSTAVVVDDPNAEFTAADTSSTGVYQEEVDDSKEMTLQEAMKANNAEPKVEEGGMSFCDCVKKQQKLEKIVLESEDEAESDKALEELNAMKTGECKILFEGNQSTLEAKQAHEKKVKACK